MRITLFRLKLLFFFSGITGLIYEIVWARLFADILGSTALAMTTVFSVFLLSLATGALVFGKSNSFGKEALKLYAKLELFIAVSATLGSFFLIFAKSWIALYIPTSSFFALDLAYKLITVILFTGLPSLLMGATLPVMLNAVREWTLPQYVVTQLYGLNTLGAALGTFLTGFVLIWLLGLSLTLAMSVLMNIIIAICVYFMARHEIRTEAVKLPQENQIEEASSPSENIKKLWFTFSFISGFSVLAYEILWGRMAKFLLGDRTLSISALLFIFIACLGLGSFITPMIARRFKMPSHVDILKLTAWFMLVAACIHLATVPLTVSTIEGQGLAKIITFENEFIRRVLTMWLLICPSILILGCIFPLLIFKTGEINLTPGKVVGNLYFINTIGAAIGAAFASFALCRWLGTVPAFVYITLSLVFFSVIFLLVTDKKMTTRCSLVLALLGIVYIGIDLPKQILVLQDDETLVKYNEDEYGVQTLVQTSAGTMRVKNNRLQLIYDLGHWQTTHAQQMAAHLTTLLAKKTENILNIGTGYGITAGTFTLYPKIKTIETIELLPFLVTHQHKFSAFNFNYLNDHRVKLMQGDGRHYLTTNTKTYDVISINVLDPYLPGSSSLYTVDLWQTVFNRLNDGGVYTQLIWGKDVPLIVKGLNKVFPTLLYFPAYGDTSYNVIGFKNIIHGRDVALQLDRISKAAKFELEDVLGSHNLTDDLNSLLDESWERRRKLNKLARAEDGPLHTDDFPVLEFRWAHGVDSVSILDSPIVVQQ